ncbi:MAG: RdgB/HAM1 family non-canonical purine NTP pyrophosphatase [Lentihominibacter sp.]|jgi:XTP/dITP diphosphohydrolase
MKTIVAATRNKHKIKEIEAITKEFGMNIVSRDEAGVPKIDIEENGETFEENSYIKAYGIMKLCGRITIADDSGLEVDCLGGAPGIYSARFAEFSGLKPSEGEVENYPYDGDNIDSDNNAKLIHLLKEVPFEKRTARFVSVITMVYPDGRTVVARGGVEGNLLLEERGTNGFGYDPVFVPLGYDKTFGELDADIKNRISHRANALRILRGKLQAENE